MAARLCSRVSFRWLPDPPTENTDTLVFNVGEYFMDLRVRTEDESIEWAMAGRRLILNQKPLRCRWIKIIDSLGPSDPDEAEFRTLDDGNDLETGSIPCPERNDAVTQFEEVWRRLTPRPGPKRAWILQSIDLENGDAFLGRVGGSLMVLHQGANAVFSAQSVEWVVDDQRAGKWMVKHSIGHIGNLTSIGEEEAEEFDGETYWRLDDVVSIRENRFIVRGLEEFE